MVFQIMEGSLVIIDYEASVSQQIKGGDYSILVISEIGAVRIQNGKIVALFHAFYDQTKQIDFQSYGRDQVEFQAQFSRMISGIPSLVDDDFEDILVHNPQDPLVIDTAFFNFCSRSSVDIQNDTQTSCFVHILSNFGTSVPKVYAKGKQLETSVLQRSQAPNKIQVFPNNEICVFEIEQLAKVKFSYAECHGSDKKYFKWCEFHRDICKDMVWMQKKQGYYHCALDDAYTLAALYLKLPKQEQVE